MWENLKENLVLPVGRRLGTAAASALVAWGVSESVAVQAEAIILVMVLLSGDLVFSAIMRKSDRVKILRGQK